MKTVKRSTAFVLAVILISLFAYTVMFVRDTRTVDQCLAFPYAKASKLEKIGNTTAEDHDCVAYLSTQNADGIQEMYLLQNRPWLHCLNVQRYIVLKHNASVMEKVGFFSTLAPSDSQKEPIDWYFYSQNDLQISQMVCVFNTFAGSQETHWFSCDPNAPFVCCVPEMRGNLRLESMVGYNQNNEAVYTCNTGLFEST